jgi:hypothetical protein
MANDDTGAYDSVEDAVSSARQALSNLGPGDLSAPDEQQDIGEPEGSTPEEEPAAADESADDSEYEEAPAEEASEDEDETPDESTDDSQQTDESESTDDDDHFWNQYPDETARKKALRETKEYAAKMSKVAREREERIKELEAKQSQPPAPPEAKPTPVDPVKRLDETYKKLYETDRSVQDRVAGLSQLKVHIDAGEKQVAEIDGRLSELSNQVASENAVLKFLQTKATADPDDLQIRDEIRNVSSTISLARTEYNDLRIAKQEIGMALKENGQFYDRSIIELRDYVRAHQEREEAQLLEEQELETVTEEVHGKWQSAIGEFFAENKIPEDEQEEINEMMRDRAAAAVDAGTIDLDNLKQWMKDIGGKPILSHRKRLEEKAMKSYANLKKRDASQPAPKGSIKTKKPSDEPLTIDQVVEQSRQQLNAELRKTVAVR